MMTKLAPHPIWWAMIRASAYRMRIYRTNMVFWVVTSLLQLYVARAIWSAVYGDRPSVNGIGAETLLVYLTIASLHELAFSKIIDYEIGERITSGQVATDLMRPFGFIRQMITIQIGSTVGFAPVILIAAPAAMLVGSLRLPDAENLAAYVVAVVLAYVVMTLTWMLVGLGGFWLMSISGLRATLSVMSGLLSGALVPLWFMPDWLRTIVELLPFQATTFLPATIFAGDVTGADLIRPLLIQAAWIAILAVVTSLTWRRAQRKLVIQGG